MSTLMMLALAPLTVGQGAALALRCPAEARLSSITVEWDGHELPLRRVEGGWLAVVGVDLEMPEGRHEARLRLGYADGHERIETQPIVVEHRDFPTTRLTVAPKYVEPDPAEQARAARENREIAAIYAKIDPVTYWSAPFIAPLPGVVGGRNFGHRRVFNGEPRAPHSGADLRAALGTPVRAANRGRVVLAKNLFFSGNAVFIDHGLGVVSTYLHLSQIGVRLGQVVERGEVIGLSGATGRVTGPHLHWGVRVLDARVDPFSLLKLGGAAPTGRDESPR